MWKVLIIFPKKMFKEFSKWYIIYFYTVRFGLPKNSETKLHIIFQVPKNAKEIFFQEFLSTLGINMQKKTLNAIL